MSRSDFSRTAHPSPSCQQRPVKPSAPVIARTDIAVRCQQAPVDRAQISSLLRCALLIRVDIVADRDRTASIETRRFNGRKDSSCHQKRTNIGLLSSRERPCPIMPILTGTKSNEGGGVRNYAHPKIIFPIIIFLLPFSSTKENKKRSGEEISIESIDNGVPSRLRWCVPHTSFKDR
jgi:hypothetical protein